MANYLHICKKSTTFAPASYQTNYKKMNAMRKRIVKTCVVLMAVLAFAACESIDPRDMFEGAYAYEATGKMSIKATLTQLNIPFEEEGTFTITKHKHEKEKVVVKWYNNSLYSNDSIYATVSGNQLILDSETYYMMVNSIQMQFTLVNPQATLVGDSLKCESDIIGKSMYNSVSVEGEGDIYLLAIKQH